MGKTCGSRGATLRCSSKSVKNIDNSQHVHYSHSCWLRKKSDRSGVTSTRASVGVSADYDEPVAIDPGDPSLILPGRSL
jgi:hypothetical protein